MLSLLMPPCPALTTVDWLIDPVSFFLFSKRFFRIVSSLDFSFLPDWYNGLMHWMIYVWVPSKDDLTYYGTEVEILLQLRRFPDSSVSLLIHSWDGQEWPQVTKTSLQYPWIGNCLMVAGNCRVNSCMWSFTKGWLFTLGQTFNPSLSGKKADVSNCEYDETQCNRSAK